MPTKKSISELTSAIGQVRYIRMHSQKTCMPITVKDVVYDSYGKLKVQAEFSGMLGEPLELDPNMLMSEEQAKKVSKYGSGPPSVEVDEHEDDDEDEAPRSMTAKKKRPIDDDDEDEDDDD